MVKKNLRENDLRHKKDTNPTPEKCWVKTNNHTPSPKRQKAQTSSRRVLCALPALEMREWRNMLIAPLICDLLRSCFFLYLSSILIRKEKNHSLFFCINLLRCFPVGLFCILKEKNNNSQARPKAY